MRYPGVRSIDPEIGRRPSHRRAWRFSRVFGVLPLRVDTTPLMTPLSALPRKKADPAVSTCPVAEHPNVGTTSSLGLGGGGQKMKYEGNRLVNQAAGGPVRVIEHTTQALPHTLPLRQPWSLPARSDRGMRLRRSSPDKATPRLLRSPSVPSMRAGLANVCGMWGDLADPGPASARPRNHCATPEGVIGPSRRSKPAGPIADAE